ncbi:ABC transporter permease [Pseudarthrobacter sp. H2]|uniref:ABC transporter permease n=1 Tax=Pseudarthrobacter sp. H2 TaxID=3418415 RepID=UPI003CEB60B0
MAVAVLLALWGWLSSQQLDSIETQSINLPYILDKSAQHIELTLYSTVIVVAVAIPGGVLLSRPRMKRLAPIALGAANVGQAAPSIAVIILAAMVFGVGMTVAVFALAIYALLPVLRNTIVGLQQVDPAIIDAGRGMGLSRRQILTRIELPLAVPIILTGLRTALVLNVGTATMAAFVNAGGLGDLIVSGVSLQRTAVLLTGSVLVALLALLIDWFGGIIQRALTTVPK